MARPSNSEQRRAQITQALAALLPQRGYDGASISAIAAQAGLAPGLVHYHFKSKEDILLALVQQLAAGLQARLDRRLAATEDPWERLDAWSDAHLALDEDADPGAVACWVAVGAEALRKPAVRHIHQAALARDLERGAELVAAVMGKAAPGEPRAQALALLAAIQGSFSLAAVSPELVPAGFAAPAVRAMARGLLS